MPLILDKPLVQYGVEEARYHVLLLGVLKIILMTSYCALQGYSFSYTRQREMLGLGHAILTGRQIVGDEAFGVILADDLCLTENEAGVMSQMAEIYDQYKCSIVAIEEVPQDQVDRYGVIAGEA